MALEYDFIHPLNADYKCSICLGLARGPKQCGECGHLFCSQCIITHGRKPCPLCRTESPQFFRDLKSKRDIDNLAVRCCNLEAGCPWTGTVGTHEDHLNTCLFALVQCTYKCESDEDGKISELMRKDLENHLSSGCLKRQIECTDCKVSYLVTEDHQLTCSKAMVDCSNKSQGCQSVLERGDLAHHLNNTCLFSIVPCTYSHLGCHQTILRKDLDDHLKEERDGHIDLMMASRSGRAEMVFKVPGFEQLKEDSRKFKSRFLCTSEGYRMTVCIDVNGQGEGEGTHVSAGVEMLQSDSQCYPDWPFQGTITYELLNQLEDSNHTSFTDNIDAAVNLKAGVARGKCKFISHEFLQHNPDTNTQYLLDDALFFRVAVTVAANKPWLRCLNRH